MEREIVALAQNCRELFPMIYMTTYIEKSVGIPTGKATSNFYIHQNNVGDLILEKTLPPQFTPINNHYSVKTIWFCEEILKRGIKLCKNDTVEKFGYIFTKVLTRVTFEYLWKKFMVCETSSVFSFDVTLLRRIIASL